MSQRILLVEVFCVIAAIIISQRPSSAYINPKLRWVPKMGCLMSPIRDWDDVKKSVTMDPRYALDCQEEIYFEDHPAMYVCILTKLDFIDFYRDNATEEKGVGDNGWPTYRYTWKVPTPIKRDNWFLQKVTDNQTVVETLIFEIWQQCAGLFPQKPTQLYSSKIWPDYRTGKADAYEYVKCATKILECTTKISKLRYNAMEATK